LGYYTLKTYKQLNLFNFFEREGELYEKQDLQIA